MSKTPAPIADQGTEQVIIRAARTVFTRKGFAAARMDDIAREAGMNRALLHYYFRSKQKMFDMIFEENMKQFYEHFMVILAGKDPLEEKIRKLVHTEVDLILQNQDLPLFIMNEITRDPARVKEKIKNIAVHQFFREFTTQVESEIRKGRIKKIEPISILMNIMSLCIFPFIGKPMMMAVSGLDQKQFEKLMHQRKSIIADMVIGSLKK